MPVPAPPASLPTDAPPSLYEETHVHEVYEQIASHFSSTRYSHWPIVKAFLLALPAGAVGVDVGCGNGKYLGVNKDVFIVGSDRSTNLVTIARGHKGQEAVVGDILALPHARREVGERGSGGGFDFAISIAVIHHLSTQERRVEAIRAILETLKDGGKALIYVWALEQKNSRRGWDEGDQQDIMVPWVMKTGKTKVKKGEEEEVVVEEKKQEEKIYERYYHLYRKDELEENIRAAGGDVLEAGYEKDNWWAVAGRKKSSD